VQDPFVSELMDTLRELSRLLVVKLDSVQQLVSEGRLVRVVLGKARSFRSLNASVAGHNGQVYPAELSGAAGRLQDRQAGPLVKVMVGSPLLRGLW
jgi:hypothetical protein